MSSLVEEFNALWADLNPKLAALAIEAKELREAPGTSSETETVADLHERLVRTRQAQDRLEAIVAEIGRVRAVARRNASDLEEIYDAAWITAMQKTRIGEYSSAKEREAAYKAACFNEYRNFRQAKRKSGEVDEVYEYCLFKYRGLDGARRDVDARIRMINVQTALEQ